MSQVGVILALIFSLIIALFALANQQLVTLDYFYGETQVSAIVVIIGSAFLGALVIFLLSLFRHIRISLQLRGLRSELTSLQEQFRELEEERDVLIDQVKQLGGQVSNETMERVPEGEDRDPLIPEKEEPSAAGQAGEQDFSPERENTLEKDAEEFNDARHSRKDKGINRTVDAAQKEKDKKADEDTGE